MQNWIFTSALRFLYCITWEACTTPHTRIKLLSACVGASYICGLRITDTYTGLLQQWHLRAEKHQIKNSICAHQTQQNKHKTMACAQYPHKHEGQCVSVHETICSSVHRLSRGSITALSDMQDWTLTGRYTCLPTSEIYCLSIHTFSPPRLTETFSAVCLVKLHR